MAEVRLDDLHKIHPGGQVALRGLDLALRDGELVVLVGPSGCGKTTALRLVAGLDVPSHGRVWIEGRDVTGLAPRERDVAMVFQSYALYPHKTVRENLGFGLRMRRVARREIDRQVEAVADSLGLGPLLERRPAQLSGGQRQRVALGRAIVRQPKVFLLDEPLSNLDARLRTETRAELARLHRRLGATMLYVTHDQEEAMTLGDRIVVLREGTVQQVGAPLEVYERPANAFVAGFIGSPAMNLLACRLDPGERPARLRGAGFALPAPLGLLAASTPGGLLLGVRPHDVEVVGEGAADATARIEVVEPLGGSVVAHATLGDEPDGPRVTLVTPPEPRLRVEERVRLRLRPDRLHVFDAASGERLG